MEILKDVSYELLLSRLDNIVLFLDNIASRIDFRAFNWDLTEDGKRYAELNKQRAECESALDSVNPSWHTNK